MFVDQIPPFYPRHPQDEPPPPPPEPEKIEKKAPEVEEPKGKGKEWLGGIPMWFYHYYPLGKQQFYVEAIVT